MKNRILLAAALIPMVAQAEMQSMSDEALSGVSGQSGLVIEVGIGSLSGVDAATEDYYGVDWSNAGVTIEATKWLVDIEGGWNQDSNTGANVNYGNATPVIGGSINRDIAVAGHLDVTIDATADLANVLANGGAVSEGDGGIGITFSNSNLNLRVGDMGFFVEDINLADIGGVGTVTGQQLSSMGGQEILGVNLDGLELVVRGNGL